MLQRCFAFGPLLLLLLGGCVVFDPPIDDGQNDNDASMEDAGDASMVSCVVPTIMAVDDCPGDIVINEVDGSGNDFIEIYNRGSVPVNISNFVVTDGTDDTPSVAEGVVFPVGTVLDPNRHIYVWANLTAPQPGLRTTDCIPESPPPCMHSSWGLSAQGEMVYLLNDSLTVVCKFKYPGTVFGNEAFGRVSDGATTLCPTNPTPGEPNLASTSR